MRLKTFAFAAPYFSLSWKISAAEVESTINDWLGRNPGVEVVVVTHDPVASFWYPPQLFVSIYYR